LITQITSWTIQIMMLLTTQFSSVSHYLLPLKPNTFLSNMPWIPSFQTIPSYWQWCCITVYLIPSFSDSSLGFIFKG
jgi:hypothetical protein